MLLRQPHGSISKDDVPQTAPLDSSCATDGEQLLITIINFLLTLRHCIVLGSYVCDLPIVFLYYRAGLL